MSLRPRSQSLGRLSRWGEGGSDTHPVCLSHWVHCHGWAQADAPHTEARKIEDTVVRIARVHVIDTVIRCAGVVVTAQGRVEDEPLAERTCLHLGGQLKLVAGRLTLRVRLSRSSLIAM